MELRNKFGVLVITWFCVIVALILLAVTMPAVESLADSGYATASASANLTNMPGSAESFNLFPFLFWFVPPVLGIIITWQTLRAN